MRDNWRRDLDNEEGKPASQWEVIVNNVGTVYSGSDEALAKETFDSYVRNGSGRADGESVGLWCDGELQDSFDPQHPEAE
jgi:hypothetical protein